MREKTIAATRNSALGLFGRLDRDVEISFRRTFEAAASGYNGGCLGQVRGNDGHQGVIRKYSRDAEAYPTNM